jgi:acetyl esterase/lipase
MTFCVSHITYSNTYKNPLCLWIRKEFESMQSDPASASPDTRRMGSMMCRFLLLLLLSFAGRAWAQAQGVEVRANLAYGPDPAEMLDLCLPQEPGATRAEVVMMHGGGWNGGARKSLLGYCRDFARGGLVVANIDYRLAGTPGGAWPAQLQDTQLAVRWLRIHAAEFGADPGRICAWGSSAGGHLAVFLAMLQRTAPGDRAIALGTVSSAVACAVDNFGPVDFTVPSPFRKALPHLAESNDGARIETLAQDISP